MKRKIIDTINRMGRLAPPPKFDAARLIARARRIAGHDDFASPDPAEPLAALFDAYERESNLTFIGRIALRQDALALLVNRLEIEQRRREEPAIAAEPIARPVFILGLPRTGTTVLHNLLSQDAAFRSPLGWEVMDSRQPAAARERERLIVRARRRCEWIYWLAPDLKVMHEVNVLHPQECIQILGHTFESYFFQDMGHVPGYLRWLERRDLTPSYHFHRRMLQHLQHGRALRAWILKAPAHLFAMDALLDVYPDAHIVQTHRDPLTVMPSLASLMATLRRAFSDRVDRRALARELLDRWSAALENAARIREARAPGGHVWLDLNYDRLMADPLAAVERLYEGFGRTLAGAAADRMRAFLQESPRHKFGRHRYALEDFAMRREDVRRRFAGYCERHAISPEG